MTRSSFLTPRYRLAVASRVIAGAVGGYALAAAATMLLSLLWPAPRAEAVMWATMLSFAVYAAAVVWVFATRSATRAWAGIMAATALLALPLWWLRSGGGA